MIICLDSGNSRIKWGAHDGAGWLAQGFAGHDDPAALAGLAARWPRPEAVWLANVAGDEAGARIRRACAPWVPVLREARATAAAAGVTSLYLAPEKLGVDRWCALIGAWSLFGAPTVVAMAGTATTVDTLDAAGRFVGGAILPGLRLMCAALAGGTAGLPLAEGSYAAYPRTTGDAILSGAIEAQVGAIERAWRRRAAENALCVLSGGHAETLSPYLEIPHRLAPNLPLEGLLRLARQG